MSFKFACPHCGQRIGAADADIGTLGGCPACGEQFRVPPPQNLTPSFLVSREVLEKAPPWQEAPRPERNGDRPSPRRGLSILALVLSIFPVLNLAGLVAGIIAVVRSDRDGRHGERGLAVCALVVCGVLLIPVNIGGYLAVGPLLHLRLPGVVEFKPVHDIPDFHPTGEAPKPGQPKLLPSTVAPKATSKIVESKPPAGEAPDINPAADLLGMGSQKAATSPGATPSATATPASK